MFSKIAVTNDDKAACFEEAFLQGLGTMQIKIVCIKITESSESSVARPRDQRRLVHEETKSETASHQTRCTVSRSSNDLVLTRSNSALVRSALSLRELDTTSTGSTNPRTLS